MICLLCGLLGAIWVGLLNLQFKPQLSPGGYAYQAISKGQPVPTPYRLRWLLPRLLGSEMSYWRLVNFVALTGCCGLLPLALPQLDPLQAVFATVLYLGLPGLIHANISMPVLMDPVSLFCTLAATAAAVHDQPLLAIGLALLGAGVKDTVPVWAAIWSLSLWPLIGLTRKGNGTRRRGSPGGRWLWQNGCSASAPAPGWAAKRKACGSPIRPRHRSMVGPPSLRPV